MFAKGKISRTNIAFICFISFLFIFLSSWNLKLPGVQWDELLHAFPAIKIIDGESTSQTYPATQVHINLFGRYLPLMVFDYIGGFKSYILAPVFSIFGPGVYSLRFTNIAIGLIAVILTFFFAKTFAGEKVAYLATILLATDPSYILYVREDFGPIAVMMVCKMTSLILLIHWWRSNRLIFLILASLVLGLGFWDKFNFIWFIAALLLTMWVLYPKELKLKNGYKLILIVSFTTLVAGVVLLIYYKAFGIFPLGISGAVNIKFLKFWVLRKTLSGIFLASWINGLNYSGLSQSFFPYLFYISLGFFPFILFTKYDRKYLFIPLIMFFIFAQIVVSLALGGHHILMLYPFVHIFCAMAFVSVFDYLHEKWIRVKPVFSCILFILIMFAITSNLTAMSSFYRELNKSGGRGHWTDAIYDVVEFLKKSDASSVVCLESWGYQLNILFLSGGRVNATTYEYISPYGEGPTDTLVRLFENKNVVYLHHSPKYQLRDKRRNYISKFREAVQQSGSRVSTIKKFYQKDGQHIFTLSKVISPNQILDNLIEGKCLYNINDPISTRFQGYKNYINFSEDPFLEQLGIGWHQLEGEKGNNFRWMQKKAVVYLKRNSDTRFLEITGYPVLKYFENKKIAMTVYINGIKAGEKTIEKEETFLFKTEIPPQLNNPDFFKVEIMLDKSFNPAKLKISSDARDMGIIISKILLSKQTF